MKAHGPPDAGVAHDANSHPSCEAGQAAGEAGSQVRVAVKQEVGLVRCLVDCMNKQQDPSASSCAA